MDLNLRRVARVLACAGVFALGIGGALLVSTDVALTQVPDPTLPDPPPIPTVPVPVPTGPDDPPGGGGGGGGGGGSGGGSGSGNPAPSGDNSGPAAKAPTKKKAVKQKPKKKKKKAQAKPAVVAPVQPPTDPPTGAGGTGGDLAATPTHFGGGDGPVFALPLRILALITIALGSAVLLVLAATPVRNLAGVSIRLAQRRGEVGLVTICIMLASLVGFVLSLMGG